jgi:hypothetical protein
MLGMSLYAAELSLLIFLLQETDMDKFLMVEIATAG